MIDLPLEMLAEELVGGAVENVAVGSILPAAANQIPAADPISSILGDLSFADNAAALPVNEIQPFFPNQNDYNVAEYDADADINAGPIIDMTMNPDGAYEASLSKKDPYEPDIYYEADPGESVYEPIDFDERAKEAGWMTADLSEMKKAFYREMGLATVMEDYTEEELARHEFMGTIYFNFAEGEALRNPDLLKNLQEVEQSTKDDNKELWQLLMRIGIKAGTEVAARVAEEKAKDSKSGKATKVMCGMFADLSRKTGTTMESMITGEKNPDLTRDVLTKLKEIWMG